MKSIEERNDDVIQNHHVMPKPSIHNVVMGAVTGFGEGLIGGVNRALDNATYGLYGGTIDSLTNGAYTNQQNRLQQQADQNGLGYVNKLANKAIDVGSQAWATKRVWDKFR